MPQQPTWVRSVTGRPDGDFYEARDRDELSHERLDDAVQDYLDEVDTPDWPATLTVKVMARMDPSSRSHQFALSLLETLIDEIEEEFGDPNDNHDFVGPGDKAECLKIMTTAVEAICAKGSAWSCEEVGVIEVDLLEYLTQENAPWLDDPDVKKWREGLGSEGSAP